MECVGSGAGKKDYMDYLEQLSLTVNWPHYQIEILGWQRGTCPAGRPPVSNNLKEVTRRG
jgi:hypothetical protein